MAWEDIPGKPGWQFNDAAQPTGRTYLGKATSELRAAEVSNGVETSGRSLTQTYLQTRYTGDPTDLTFSRGELNATFQNIKNGIAGKQAASYYSALGGGGGGQPSLNGTHSYDTEFGYLVAKLTLDTTFHTNPRNQGNVTIDGASNQIMTDADFATVMSDATHITFCFESSGSVLTLPSAQANRAIVHTKAQIVDDPNVLTFPTTSLSTLGQTNTSGYGIIWHNENTGADLTGSDYSGLGILLSGVADASHWGLSSIGYNQVSHNNQSTEQASYRTYNQDIMTIWVTNSGVAPVLT